MKIAVVGPGHVGTSLAILLARHNDVMALDLDPGRVAAINARCSPVVDPDCSGWLQKDGLSLRATADPAEADLIVANRFFPELHDVAGKVFTRDLFGID